METNTIIGYRGVNYLENQICSRFEEGNFRSPAGAVPTDSSIIFEIEVPRLYGLKDVYLVRIQDDTNQYDYFKMIWMGIHNGRDVYETTINVDKKGLNWYYFQLSSSTHVSYLGKDKQSFIITDVEPPSWQLTVYDPSFSTPDWIKGGIIYHLFVDRFFRVGKPELKKDTIIREDWGGLPIYAPNEDGEILNNDFFGGNLKGIVSKLDYILSLGVTCIYLSPIFEAYSNHKYDTGDFTRIDSMFGTLDDFHELCREGKKRGIRILLDGVFNHTGSDSFYFNKKGTYDSIGAYQSKESIYYHWYKFIDYPDQYESWWGIDTLPAVKEVEPTYLNFITGKEGIARKWLKEGASGWRLDVVDELPDLFLERFRKTVKDYNPDSLIIGEVWEDASHKKAYGNRRHYFMGKQLDSVMNYPFMNAIIKFVRYGDAETLHDVVMSILQNYPHQVVHCLMNMLGTHDTRRILTALGGNELNNASKEEMSKETMTNSERQKAIQLLQMASLIQMTLPGVPCIYYGDEVGLEGYEDPFNRRCYPWGQEEELLLNWYKKLGDLRKSWTVFKEGDYETIYAQHRVFVFQRYNEDEKVVIGVNRSNEPFPLETGEGYDNVLEEHSVKGEYIIQPNGYCLLAKKH